MKALPGKYEVYADMTIDEAMARFVEKHGILPEIAAVNVGYRITDTETLVLREDNVQLMMFASIHNVWLGPVPE